MIIWKLDRLSRNLRDGVNVLADWAEKGLKIVVVTQQLELNGVIGRTIAALLLGLAEIEHGNIRERQKAGIEAAKARGVYTGRAVGSTKAHPGRARELKRKGLSMDEIATALEAVAGPGARATGAIARDVTQPRARGLAQDRMREHVRGVGFCLMIATMLHSIATGNLLPAWVKVACVDINPATVTKLTDRGSVQTVGVVTDVEPFLRALVTELGVSNA